MDAAAEKEKVNAKDDQNASQNTLHNLVGFSCKERNHNKAGGKVANRRKEYLFPVDKFPVADCIGGICRQGQETGNCCADRG